MYLDIERPSRLAPEAPDLLDEPHGCLTDQDPHALPLLLNLPRHHRRLRHHAVVGDFRPGDNSNGGPTSLFSVKRKTLPPQLFFSPVKSHSNVQLGVGFVRNLEHNRPGQEVESHAGDLYHMVVS